MWLEAAFLFEFRLDQVPGVRSFANYEVMHEGGTHLQAFYKGIKQALAAWNREVAPETDYRKPIASIKALVKGAVHVQLSQPVFHGPSRTKLGNTEIINEVAAQVRESLLRMLRMHPQEAEKVLGLVNIHALMNGSKPASEID